MFSHISEIGSELECKQNSLYNSAEQIKPSTPSMIHHKKKERKPHSVNMLDFIFCSVNYRDTVELGGKESFFEHADTSSLQALFCLGRRQQRALTKILSESSNVSCLMHYVFTSALLRKAYIIGLSPTDNRNKHINSTHEWSSFMNVKYG